MFEIIDTPKWNIKYSSESTFKLSEEYVFNDQQVIVEEDREESDIESIQNKSIMKNNQLFQNYLPENVISTTSAMINAGGSSSGIVQTCDLSKSLVENRSVLSNDEKDLQIRFLKKELEFYKNRCEMFQKMLNNPAMVQMQAMQMLNPLASTLAFNNNLMYQSMQGGSFQPQPQQVGFMQQNLNMMSYQNNIANNLVLSQSRASTNIQKILNQSDLYEEEVGNVPEPVPINK